MIYFITIAILIVLIGVYDFNGFKKAKYANYYLVLTLLILTAGVRYRIGLDTIRYMSSFENMPTLFNMTLTDFKETRYDPIFYLLSIFSKTIYPDFVFFQILHATILNSIVFYFITLFFEVVLGIWSLTIFVIGISEIQKIRIIPF